MIKVRFFASLREQLDQSEMDLPWTADLNTVEAIRTALIDGGGELWRQVLAAPNVITALNHAVVDLTEPVSEGDEIAFYPPVTGG